jgi:hypothetical protein
MARTTKAPTTTTTDEATTEAPTVPTLTVDGVTITTDPELAVEAYGNASTGVKTKIRNAVTSAMKDAIGAMDLPTAQLWVAVTNAIEAQAAKKATPVTDWNQTLADRIIALRYAAHRLTMGDVTPEGFGGEVDLAKVNELVDAYLAQGDLDAVSNEVGEAGTKIARAKITRSVVRGSVEAHLETAFAELPVGSKLTVAQIRTRSGAASDGAIAARLWPTPDKSGNARTTTIDLVGMGLALADIDGTRAVEKVADAS